MYGYIYLITDTNNGKQYIGQHKYDKAELDPDYHGSGNLIKKIYAKRPETLIEELLFIAATYDELNYFETYFIERLNTLYPNGYNLNTGGYRPKLSEESIRKMSVAVKKAMTPEVCKKISEANKGKTPYNKGKFKVPHEEIYNYYINNNLPIKEIAKKFNYSIRTIIRIINYYKEK